MTYEIYRYIFLGSAVLACIMLIVSILIFVLLKIPVVIGDLSGANARKAINKIRIQNENSGDKTYKSSLINKERGKLTDKISASGKIVKNTTGNTYGAMATDKLDTQELIGGGETAVLDSNNTATLETVVLSDNIINNFTTFEIEYDITYIHTNEII